MTDAETLEAAPQIAEQGNVEARARAQGWRPKEEFKGPAERWRPADEFLRAAETFMPVAIERNRALEHKLEQATNKIHEMTQAFSEFREFASRGEQRAYDRARAELMAKREVAVAHADTETFKQVDREIAELDKSAVPKPEPRREAVPTQQAVQPPEITAWLAENSWFNRDPVLYSLAKSLDAEYERSRPGIELRDRLAAVTAEVQRRFPEKFENPNREAATSVSAPRGGAAPKAAKHSYENLPPEAKRACDKFVKTIPGFKVEDYVRDYDWGDA